MFTEFEKEAYQEVLEDAIRSLGNRVCNDYPVQITNENRQDIIQFIETYVEVSGDDDQDYKDHLLGQVSYGEVYFTDFLILQALKNKLFS